MSAPATPAPVAAASQAAGASSSASSSGSSSGSSGTSRSSSTATVRVSERAAQQQQRRAAAEVSMFTAAPQADLFRALQKDDYMLVRWREEWSELSSSLLGGGLVARVEPELDFLCRAAYFGATSLRAKPTLGEEYVDVQQVAPIQPNVYEDFRRQRAQRRAQARMNRLEQQQQEQQRLPPPTPIIPAAPVQSAESASAVVPAVSAAASAAASSASAAASAPLISIAAATSALLPSQIIHAAPAAGSRLPAAAPLFTWARYNRFELPSARRRFALFFVQVCAPYLYERLQRHSRRLLFDVAAQQAALERERRQQLERVRRFAAHDMPVVDLADAAVGDADAEFSSGLVQRVRRLLHSNASLHLKLMWNRLVSLLLRSSDHTLSSQLQRLHLALFYLAGRYLELSKRVVGIQYVQLRKLDVARPGYELFGVLLLIQVAVGLGRILRDSVRALRARDDDEDGEDQEDGSIAHAYALDGSGGGGGGGGEYGAGAGVSASGLYALSAGERLEEAEEAREVHVRQAPRHPPAAAAVAGRAHAPAAAAVGSGSGPRNNIHSLPAASAESASESESDSDSDSDDDSRPSCTLCLCPRTHTTATECGHLFCWECISAAVTAKPECPLCRQPCALNLLLLLPQYK